MDGGKREPADGLRRNQILRSLAEILAADPPIEELWPGYCRGLIALTDAARVRVVVRTPQGDRVAHCSERGAETRESPLEVPAIAQRALSAGETVTCEHSAHTDICIPIRFARNVLGAIVFESLDSHDAELLRMLESCCLYAGARLDRDLMLQSSARYAQAALTDALTGVTNRRGFDEKLEIEAKRARRDAAELSVLMIDVDFFKAFNDYYGHQAGDLCLIQLARALREEVYRPADIFARYGGEEFVVLLPETSLEGGAALAERLLKRVRTLRIPHHGSSLGYVSVTIGVASMEIRGTHSAADVLSAADAALYEAKRNGRNRLYATGIVLKDSTEPVFARAAGTHNLPLPLTRLIGRTAEVAAIQTLIAEHRLVSILGMGGTGKTRVAIRAAMQSLAHFHDGAWFVDLTRVRDEQGLLGAIASIFCVPRSAANMLQAVANALQTKHALLVLDNCEHVIDAAAKVTAELVATCPRLHVLCTSREALRVGGEAVYKLPMLEFPPAGTTDAAELLRYDAIALFVDRAHKVQPQLELTAESLRIIADICSALEGIALAIELAAARLNVFSLLQLRQRVRPRLGLLTGGDRAVPRQQTIRALIDWSYDLLSEPERMLFSRLSIFAGSWTLEAVLEVCADGLGPQQIIEGLSSLIAKSLVIEEGLGVQHRYRLLEALREYAEEKLDADALAALSSRHCAHYAAAALCEPSPRDLDNYRRALHWALVQGADVVSGGKLAAALGDYFSMVSPGEGVRWAQIALNAGANHAAITRGDLEYIVALSDALAPDEIREAAQRSVDLYRSAQWVTGEIKSLCALAQHLVWYYPDEAHRAELLAAQALSLARERAEEPLIGLSLRVYGLAIQRRDARRASDLYHESLDIFKSLKNDRQISGILMWLSELEFAQGSPASMIHAREALRHAEASGLTNHHVCAASNLAQLAAGADDVATMIRAVETVLRIAREAHLEVFVTWAVQALAIANAHASLLENAARLIGFCDARIGNVHAERQVGSIEKILYARLMSMLQQRVPPQRLAGLSADGSRLSLESAVELGRAALR